MIERVDGEPRLELFARRKRHGWASWGNEIANDVEMPNDQAHPTAAEREVERKKETGI